MTGGYTAGGRGGYTQPQTPSYNDVSQGQQVNSQIFTGN